jgi:hypothetical protein
VGDLSSAAHDKSLTDFDTMGVIQHQGTRFALGEAFRITWYQFELDGDSSKGIAPL